MPSYKINASIWRILDENTSSPKRTVQSRYYIIETITQSKPKASKIDEVSNELNKHDKIHILNLGGVIGNCKDFNILLGPATECEVLGSIVDNTLLKRGNPWSEIGEIGNPITIIRNG